MLGLELGLGRRSGGYGAVVSAVIFWLQNVLSLVAKVGTDSTFSRGGSTVTVPAWDATLGSILITTASDAIASPYMRFDAGSWFNDDGSGNSLHPTNAAGVFIVYPSWLDTEVVPADSYRVDFVGVQAKYYHTVAGGTSSGTGVADDTGVTDWVLQGNYSNGGGGTLPGLLREGVAINLPLHSQDFSNAVWSKVNASITTDQIMAPDGALTADLYTGPTTSLSNYVFQTITLAVNQASITLYAKAGTHPYINVNVYQASLNWGVATFDLSDGSEGDSAVGSTSGTINEVDIKPIGGGWYKIRLSVTTASDASFCVVSMSEFKTGNSYGIDGLAVGPAGNKTFYIWQMDCVAGLAVSSPIKTTTGSVQRNASTEANLHVITAQFMRYRVTDTNTETHLTDGTNSFDYDEATTTLTFTDGTTTLTTVTALAIGDTIVLDQINGTLYVNGTLKDTDGALATSWAAITGIGNITDLQESTDIDPTNITWDK